MNTDFCAVVAVDGPAASGKTTVARLVAKQLGWAFVSTGSMYRAVTFALLGENVDTTNPQQVADYVESGKLQFTTQFVEEEGIKIGHFLVNDFLAAEEQLASTEVNEQVSFVAQVPEVRQRLVELQRSFACRHALVMEGRDIGTVVFPQTPYKIFVTASVEVRAKRRAAQGVLDDLKQRDLRDRMRKHSPLQEAEDATVIDSTNLNLEETVAAVLKDLQQKNIASVEG